MYYTGYDPFTMKKVYVATDYHEKQMQRALLQYKNPKNADLVCKALVTANRQDLIGFDKSCLIQPARGQNAKSFQKKTNALYSKPLQKKNGTKGHNFKKTAKKSTQKKGRV
jgi:hypothetical protein